MRYFARTLCFASLGLTVMSSMVMAEAQQPPALWDLHALFATDAAWDAERQAIEALVPTLAALKGSFTDSAALEAGLDKIWATKKRLAKLDTYASLSADVDTRMDANQVRRQKANDLRNKVEETTSFVKPEIIALGRQRVEAFITERPGLAKDRYELQSILREADHTLGQEAETVLAAAQTPLEQPESIFSLLSNADIPWPTIDIHGKKITLDQEGYVTHRSDRDPKIRQTVFETFWPVFKTYERTFGAIYAANLRGTAFSAKVRKYPDAMSAVLARDNVPPQVYRTLIAEAHNGLPTLHRYLALGKKLLGLKTYRYSDVYVPFAAPPRHYTLAEAEQLTLRAVKPLGDAYGQDLNDGFQGAWMHAQPQRGKRSGAYMNGAAYDVHPFVLLSFSGNFDSVSTLAHEFGHAMHTVLANRAQPFETADYSIFVAEIPSTTNEMLLADDVIAHSHSKAEKIYALSQALELLRATFFRQAMFAEFEAETHAAIERGEPLTGESLSKIYLALLRRYMGEAEGVMTVDDIYGVEWAYIPHFYSDFYVYQYATSISAAAYFAEGLEKGDTTLRERYFDMLKAGGSDDPYLIVKKAGPDLASPEPYQALVRRMNHLLDQLETVLAENG